MMNTRDIKSASATYQVGGSSVPRKQKSSTRKEATPLVDPIDDNKQDEIVSKLKQDADRQARNGRTTFYYLFMTIAGIFGVCLLCSVAYPIDVEHQVRLISL